MDVRALDGEEQARASHRLFRAALHRPEMSAEQWRHVRRSYEPGRALGAFDGGRMVGTALAWSSDLVLPGGAVAPMAAVTRIGVRADHRRRGTLTAMMRAQLADVAARGEALAGLHPTEPLIYGRYGYGPATRAHTTRTRPVALRPEVPTGGAVRLVGPDEAMALLPALHERCRRSRAGAVGRARAWWSTSYERAFGIDEHLVVAVRTGPDGDDGFAAWRPHVGENPNDGATLDVIDLVAAHPGAANALWAFLLASDLTEQVVAPRRPVDEPLDAMVADPRATSLGPLVDDLWLRLVDVPAALSARAYGEAEPVVLEVVDRFLPANSGRYLLGPSGVARTDAPAGLSVDVDALAMLYLGGWRCGQLAGIGRVRVHDERALTAADRLFATDRPPWCGTYF